MKGGRFFRVGFGSLGPPLATSEKKWWVMLFARDAPRQAAC
jgi:hypothetical protein